MIAVDRSKPPSTLADVLRHVIESFDLAYGDRVPIQVGGQYREHFGTGEGPKILFVPETNGSKYTDPIEMGTAAGGKSHHCDVYVRGFEGFDDDLARFDNADKLADTVIGALRVAAPGRLELGPSNDDSPAKTNSYGAGIAFGFNYRRDIPHWAARWALNFGGPSLPIEGGTVTPTVTPKE